MTESVYDGYKRLKFDRPHPRVLRITMDNPGANGSMSKIGVLIVDDIVDTRDNLSKLLMFERDIEVVGTAASGPGRHRRPGP